MSELSRSPGPEPGGIFVSSDKDLLPGYFASQEYIRFPIHTQIVAGYSLIFCYVITKGYTAICKRCEIFSMA